MYKYVLLLTFISLSITACSQEKGEHFQITIKDHQFSPATLEVPAGKKIDLLVINQDATAEEFESHDLKREKVIAGNSQATISINPLVAGEYKFVGEFNEKTAKGTLVAK